MRKQSATFSTSTQLTDVSLRYLVGLRLLGRALEFPPRLRSAAIRSGQIESLQRGRGIDFDEVRRYQPGDDIRAMDWRVMARTGQPHTRLYHEERERPAYFWVDYSPAMFFGTRRTLKWIAAAEVASILAWSVAAAGDSVGGCLFTGQESISSVLSSGSKGVLHFLHQLEQKQPSQIVALEQAQLSANRRSSLERLHATVTNGQLTFLVGDFVHWGENEKKQLRALALRTELTLVQISDPIEVAPPTGGNYRVSNGADFATWRVSTQPTRNPFYQQRQENWYALQQFCSAHAIRLFATSTDCSPEQFALRFVKSGRYGGLLRHFIELSNDSAAPDRGSR